LTASARKPISMNLVVTSSTHETRLTNDHLHPAQALPLLAVP
jgi:hypothetical protein